MKTSKQKTLATSKKILKLTWPKYLELIDRLGNMIEPHLKQMNIDYIYGVPRGGLIPATILSHRLRIPLIVSPKPFRSTYILVIDDICDSGSILKEQAEYWNPCWTAVLFERSKSRFKPDFCVKINDKNWIRFPYEKQ